MTEVPTSSRLNVDIDRDLAKRLNECVPWGVKSHLLRSLLELLVDAVERDGPIIIGAVLAKNIQLRIREEGK